MAKQNNLAGHLLNMMNLGGSEETRKPVQRATTLQDLQQITVKTTTLNPATGRQTVVEVPASIFLPSGHYVVDPNIGLQGECRFCRSEFEDEGTPDLVTLVPREQGGGGICARCGSVACAEHGSMADDCRFLCDDCTTAEKWQNIKKGLLTWFFEKKKTDQ